MEVSFKALSYTSSFPRKRKLLDEVNGRFLPGQLTGILGPSGAGKTTLLNAISGYRRSGRSGLVEGVTLRNSCYIGQEDILAPLMTAGELMAFASQLKLPVSYSHKQRAAVVEQLMSTLNLDHCYDTWTEKLSGGQRRRMSIALELINNPPVLFLDEPTSGLDTVAAYQIIRLLSELSRAGRTIVCTIHQPSASLFDVFDRVYILARGKCVYQGGSGRHLLLYLEINGFVCPTHYNIADYVIELTEDERNIDVMCKASRNGKEDWFSKEEAQIKPPSTKALADSKCLKYVEMDKESVLQERGFAPFWLQFITILARLLLQAKRNKIAMYIQFYHHLGCGLAMGLIFYQKANDGIEFFNQMKLCTGIILFHAYTQLMVPILYYPFEVKLLKREHFNRWYGLLPYYAAFTASKLPYLLFLNMLYMTLMYWLSGIPWEVERFVLFCVVGILTSLVAEALGLTIGATFSVTNGTAVGPLTLAPFFGLAMYGLDFAKAMPWIMHHLVRASFMRAGTFSMIFAVFGLDRGRMPCEIEKDPCHFRDPKVVLHFLGMHNLSILRPLFDLCLSLFIFRLAFYLALKWRLRR